MHSFFISSPSTPFWEFINSLSMYNYCHYITTWSCMLSFEMTCLITKKSYIVIASAKTSGSIYLKVLISVRIVTKTTIGANFLGMKRTQKCEGKLEHCSCVCSRKWTYIGKRCENTEIQTNTRVWHHLWFIFFCDLWVN